MQVPRHWRNQVFFRFGDLWGLRFPDGRVVFCSRRYPVPEITRDKEQAILDKEADRWKKVKEARLAEHEGRPSGGKER